MTRKKANLYPVTGSEFKVQTRIIKPLLSQDCHDKLFMAMADKTDYVEFVLNKHEAVYLRNVIDYSLEQLESPVKYARDKSVYLSVKWLRMELAHQLQLERYEKAQAIQELIHFVREREKLHRKEINKMPKL